MRNPATQLRAYVARDPPYSSDLQYRLQPSVHAEKTKRTTPLSMDEVAARNRFKAVEAAVRARQQDPSKITQDQLNFIAQKNTADGRKTMKKYLWKLEGEIYDQSH